MPNIHLESSDKEVFEVDLTIAERSGTLKDMIETLGMSEDDKEAIPLPTLDGAILKKVIEWLTYHQNDPPAPRKDPNAEKRTDDICAWDMEFLKVEQGTLFQLLTAANYLDIKGLLESTCKTIANMMKGKSAEDIRKTFNIPNDLPATEEMNEEK